MAPLTESSYVVLGMLRLGARSGYEIRQAVAVSIRHFWAISYGQIYPELKRLEAAGLVTGEDDAGSARGRRLYATTPAGEEALRAWLREPAKRPPELRDLGLLKLFFAGAEPSAALVQLESMRATARAQLDRLRQECRPLAEGVREARDDPHPLVALGYGLELYEALLAWCDESEAQLRG